MSEACISVAIANGVTSDSWLNDPEHQSFRAAYAYASNQSCAIPGLSQITAEQAYNVYFALKRGEENFERREAEERRRAKDEHEADALEMVGMVWREVEPRAGERHTITITERIPFWGFYAERSDGGPWSLTEWALMDYYEPVLDQGAA